MKRKPLELILESDICNMKYGNDLDLDYTFLDLMHVRDRVEWYSFYSSRLTHLENDFPDFYAAYKDQQTLSYSDWLLLKAFEEIV